MRLYKISHFLNYTSIMVMGGVDNILLKDIKLVDIGNDSALLVIITDNGLLKDKIIDIPQNMQGKFFAHAILSSAFSSLPIFMLISTSSSFIRL